LSSPGWTAPPRWTWPRPTWPAWCGTRPRDAKAVEPDRPIRAEAPDRLVAAVDEARIRQVLANLLGNIREHTPKGTPVAVRLAQVRGGVVLEVADAGPGMSEQDAAQAFDRFHRAARADVDGQGPAAPAEHGPGGSGPPDRDSSRDPDRDSSGRPDGDSHEPGSGGRQRAWPVHCAGDRRGPRRPGDARILARPRHQGTDLAARAPRRAQPVTEASDAVARFELLRSPLGKELLDRLAEQEVTPDRVLRIGSQLRRSYPAELVADALAQHELRLRARAKFSRAMQMFFTRPGLEVASSEVVARHHAARYAAFDAVSDLCCGIGGDTLALAGNGRSVDAVDRDPLHLRIAEVNAGVYGVG